MIVKHDRNLECDTPQQKPFNRERNYKGLEISSAESPQLLRWVSRVLLPTCKRKDKRNEGGENVFLTSVWNKR